MDEFELRAPPVVFPGQTDAASAYRVAFDLLSRRAPDEALLVIEPALAEDPTNTGLRTLRAWAFFVKVQLGRAE
ncbi:MAG: tetratricopeptide repeat protein, partial [Microbacterium sp.]